MIAVGLLAFAGSIVMSSFSVLAISGSILFTTGIIIVSLGVFRINMSFFADNLCVLPKPGNWIALTFDDGPHKETERLLDIFDQNQVKATFFCIGKEAEKYPATLQRIISSGHTVGSHTYSHSWKYMFASDLKVASELAKGAETIAGVIGKRPVLFRPPFGITNPSIGRAIRANQMKSIGWNIRTFDTMTTNGEDILTKVSKQLKPGAIILMHDRLETTVNILPKILDEIKKRGFTPVSLEEALNQKIYV